MFYCEQCRRAKAWPATARSDGTCELCERVISCHWAPDRHLPGFPPPLEE